MHGWELLSTKCREHLILFIFHCQQHRYFHWQISRIADPKKSTRATRRFVRLPRSRRSSRSFNDNEGSADPRVHFIFFCHARERIMTARARSKTLGTPHLPRSFRILFPAVYKELIIRLVCEKESRNTVQIESNFGSRCMYVCTRRVYD